MLEFDSQSKCYIGRSVEMPAVFGEGKSVDACAKDTQRATIAAICTLLELRRRVPAPASNASRTEQLNVRLSASEKSSLDAAASREGFRSVSDFVRAVALRAS
jgi:hypothetical protein